MGGIHYHMFSSQKVEYFARDPQRQEIPWVRLMRADGEVVEHEHLEDPSSESEREKLEVHVMECLDCHSRPAHLFQAPINSVDQALANGMLWRSRSEDVDESIALLQTIYRDTIFP